MNPHLRLIGPGAALALAIAALPAQGDVFAVHEWGTFTSMVGSDGITLEGLQHEEERLPDFCHELASLVEANGDGTNSGLKFPATRVTQKMETPVIYFHTDRPREVSVQVHFPGGLLTQFYPIPMFVSPTLDQRRLAGPIDLSEVRQSSLIWNVDLLPFGGPAPEQIPACAPDDPWALARQVRAASVRTRDPEGVRRAVEAEHFLFYRGLGRFAAPLRLQAHPNGSGQLTNASARPVPFAVVMENAQPDENGVHRTRFAELGAIRGGATIDFSLDEQGSATFDDRDRSTAALGARVFDALIRQGLHDDEARAMIATWSRSWFRTVGTRVIYVLPREDVDRLLPLRIRPTPDRLVRVLVGRLEWITPETESRVEVALRDLESDDAATVAAARCVIRDLERFAEPHIRRALELSPPGSASARQARAILAEITDTADERPKSDAR